MYQLRPYQQEASDRAVAFLTNRKAPTYAGLIVAGTGTGKSLIIADIAHRLQSDVLVLQPSKEILEQNFAKLQSYGVFSCSIYSASCGSKEISSITFATIGSIASKVEHFKHFRYCIIDECDTVNASEGQYIKFLREVGCRTVGLTATPYRLCQAMDYTTGEYGYELKFLTRTRPRYFGELLYYTQQPDMASRGYLSPMRYFDLTKIDMRNLRPNSTGQNFTEESVRHAFEACGFRDELSATIFRLLHNATPRRNGILVFTQFIEEAEALVDRFGSIAALVTGSTPKREREDILERFKAGEIRVVANVNCLSVGFDYPELDTVVLARPTMSLRLYYQQVGRAIRPHKDKTEAWVIDLVGNTARFGRVEDLVISDQTGRGAWVVQSNGKQLTNTILKP